MNWLYRWLLWGVILTTAALLWWYPPPELVAWERPQWHSEYESYYRSGGSILAWQRSQERTLDEFITFRLAQLPLTTLPTEAHSFLGSGQRGFLSSEAASAWIGSGWAGYWLLDDGRPSTDSVRWRRLSPSDYREYNVPPAYRFLLRDWLPWWMSGLLLLAATVGRMPVDPRLATMSTAGIAAGVSLLLPVAAGLLAWPFLFQIDGIDVAYASMFVGLWLTVSLGLSWLLLAKQFRSMENLLSGQTPLASWQFSTDEWQYHQQQKDLDCYARRTLLWWVVAGVFLLFGSSWFFFSGESQPWRPLATLMLFLAFWKLLQSVRSRQDRTNEAPGQGLILVGPEGIYASGEVHHWNSLWARWQGADGVIWIEGYPYLRIRYRTWTAGTGRSTAGVHWQSVTADIPVSTEAVAVARHAAAVLAKAIP